MALHCHVEEKIALIVKPAIYLFMQIALLKLTAVGKHLQISWHKLFQQCLMVIWTLSEGPSYLCLLSWRKQNSLQRINSFSTFSAVLSKFSFAQSPGVSRRSSFDVTVNNINTVLRTGHNADCCRLKWPSYAWNAFLWRPGHRTCAIWIAVLFSCLDNVIQ